MRLTKTAIDRACYQGQGNRRQILWDAGLPGFGLRVYPSGRKTFVVFYRSGPRQRLMSLGAFGVLTLKQARDKARKILVAARDGLDPLQQRHDRANAETVAAFCELYLEQHSKPKKKSWREDQRRIRKHIVPAIGSIALEKVSRADVSRFYHRLGSRKPYEANRVLSLLSNIFNVAALWGAVDEGRLNPAKIPKSMRFKERTRDRPLTSEELPRLLTALDDEPDPYVRTAIRLYMLTGLRKREILHARWKDIDLPRGTLRLPDTKAGRPRHVPLSRDALKLFRDLPRTVGNPYVFASPNKHGQALKDLYKPWSRIREAAGCPDLRIHDLRHSVATWLAEEGNAAQFIQQALGHQSLQTTMKYIHAVGAGPREALEGLGAKLTQMAESEAAGSTAS